MKKVLITRFGAVGDHIHCTHLPRLLKQKAGFDYVAVEYNVKGKEAWKHNPFVDEHIHFDPNIQLKGGWPESVYRKRWEEMLTLGGFEKHLMLQKSLEYGYIAMEDQAEYYRDSRYRREKFGGHNYYDQTSIFAGYPEWCGIVGDLYFTEQEENLVRGIYEERYKDKFVIIANLSGTSRHKLFYQADAIIRSFLAKHEDAICITMGDDDCKNHIEFTGDRIINRCGRREHGLYYPFRQSMLMTKYCNLLIGAESGLMVAGTLLGAPTVQLMTAASIKNHGGDFVNDFSLQSPATCSPCHKGPYDYIGCPKFEIAGEKYPVCVKFEAQVILNQMEKVYDRYTKAPRGSSSMSSM
jgi:ADP-heptose:LPS heptosyltransferase